MRCALVLACGVLVACQSTVVAPEGQGGGTAAGVACAGGKTVLAADGSDSGFVLCPDGATTRARSVTCDTTVVAPGCAGDEGQIDCHSSADCTGKPHGACVHGETESFGGFVTTCGCAYPCATDADCHADEACIARGLAPLAGGWSMCTRKSGCTSNEDCPSGECSLSVFKNDCLEVHVELACRRPTDTCVRDADCADSGSGYVCRAEGGVEWHCVSPDCHT